MCHPAIDRALCNGPAVVPETLIDSWSPRAPTGVDVDSALAKPASPRTLLGEVQRLLGRQPADALVAV